MASLIQSYGGVNTPSFLIIEKVSFQVLPASQVKQLEIPIKSGAYFINKKHGVRTFTASFSIKASDSNSVMYYADDLAEWINYDEPQPLIFRDKPDQIYHAIIEGSVDITKFGKTGRGQIIFLCLDPHGYGTEKTYSFNPTDTDPIILVNGGNQKTAPVMSMEFKKNVTDFAIVSDNNMLYFGEPFDVSQNTAVDLNPQPLSLSGLTTTGWTAGLTVDNGTIIPNILASNGYSIGPYTPSGYGTSSGLHGGSLIHTVGKQVQDFTMEAYISFNTSHWHELGKIEFYLLDVNGSKIGKIALSDTSATQHSVKLEARAGSIQSGYMFVNQYGQTHVDQFTKFDGVLKLTRKGNEWSVYVAKTDINKKHYNIFTKSWKDTGNLYSTAKLSSIQLFIGAYDAYNPILTNYFSYLRVIEHLSPQANEIDFAFKTGDKLTIDNTTGEILKNGEPFYEKLYPSSSFILLDKGANGISVSDPAIFNGEIKFKERWL